MEAKDNKSKTITLTPDLLNDIEELKPYDEEYGLVVYNLFAVAENQFAAIYGAIDKLDLSNEAKNETLNFLFQTQDIIKIIKSKVSDIDIFLMIDNILHELKKQTKQK